MDSELLKRICNAENNKEALEIATETIKNVEKYDNSKTVGFKTSRVDDTTTSFVNGYLSSDCVVKYDSSDSFAKYRVDFENILPDFIDFIRKKKLDDINKLMPKLSEFLISYFGITTDDIDHRSEYQYNIVDKQIENKNVSDDEYFKLFDKHQISMFKRIGYAECTEYAAVTQCILSMLGMKPKMILGKYADSKKTEYHAFNILLRSNGILIVIDSANPHLVYDVKGNLIDSYTTIKTFSDVSLDEFLSGDKELKIEKYNGLKTAEGKIKYIDCDIETLSYEDEIKKTIVK